MHPNKYFTPQEARDLVGVRIRSLVAFSGIESGTTGKIVGLYHHTPTQCGIEVQWDLLGRPVPLVDGFSKTEFYDFLEVLE